MKKSPFRFLAAVMILPIFLGAGCAWQSDLNLLRRQVGDLQNDMKSANAVMAASTKQTLATATAAARTAEQAVNAAQKAAAAVDAVNMKVARMLEKPKTVAYALEFGFNKSRVNNLMGRQLDAILNDWKGKPAIFWLVGHADSVGPKEQNLVLARERAEEVKNALVRRGVPSSIVSAIGVGEEAPMVQTEDGRRKRANRVVVLTIAAQKN